MRSRHDFRRLPLAALALPQPRAAEGIGGAVAHVNDEVLVPDPRAAMTACQVIDDKLSASLGRRPARRPAGPSLLTTEH
jgi:hypothetical protein